MKISRKTLFAALLALSLALNAFGAYRYFARQAEHDAMLEERCSRLSGVLGRIGGYYANYAADEGARAELLGCYTTLANQFDALEDGSLADLLLSGETKSAAFKAAFAETRSAAETILAILRAAI